MTIEKIILNLRQMPGLFGRMIFLFVIVLFYADLTYGSKAGFQVILKPSPSVLMTDTIQRAIDLCSQNGGGTVVFTKGTYLSGSIQLQSNISIQLQDGALLQGSDKYADYRKDAFLFGKDLTDVNIEGEGIIDGVDCYNPRGEEGFRGPHAIRFINCSNIFIKGITIKNAANYALYFRYCINVTVENVSIRGGHDGLHTRFGKNFTISACDFRTGDDAFAGNDNQDFVVTDCSINSSCNGFRMGCINFTVKQCRIWGPGEYIHKVQKRNNMLTAFVHFSPKDDNSKLKSGNWLIQDVTIENVDQVYNYNFDDGKWQTGQPVTDIKFERVKASGILKAFTIIGDKERTFNLNIINSSFIFKEGAVDRVTSFEGSKVGSQAFLNARNFDKIELHGVTFSKTGTSHILALSSGNALLLDDVTFKTGQNVIPFSLKKINEIKKKNVKLNSVILSEDFNSNK